MVEAVLTRMEAGASRLTLGRLAGFDMALVYAFLVLGLLGLVTSFAASPVAAYRLGIDAPFYFTERHLLFLSVALFAGLGAAFLSPDQARRLGVLMAFGALGLALITLIVGPEIKGARRWFYLFGFGLQPAEFLKTGFVFCSAWFLSAGREDRFPGSMAALGLYAFSALLLLAQPDYGQWMLLTGIWAVVFFVAGWSWAWIGGLGTAAAGALGLGYLTQSHVRSRIDRFINPESGDTYQTDKALEAISSGGVFGHDLHELPGVKASLPDAQTDFIFAVAVEEFGLVMGLLIILLFAIIAVRGFYAALNARDTFTPCAVAGLTASLSFQAAINIGVNLSVLPAKGMTLPLISYGGSSLIATALTAGFLLALTRKRTP